MTTDAGILGLCTQVLQLKAENAELTAEIRDLRAELAILRASTDPPAHRPVEQVYGEWR